MDDELGAGRRSAVDETFVRSLLRMTAKANIVSLVEAFVDDGALQVQRMRGALTGSEVPVLAEAAHRLRGGAAAIGAVELSEVCAAVERGEGDPEAAVGRVEDALDRAAADLRTLLTE